MCKDTDGNYKILDDSIATSQCTTSYSYAISQVVKILGINKATTQYDQSLGYQTVVNYLIKYNKIYSVSKFE